MNDVFKIQIPKNKHYYIIIPEGCEGSVAKSLDGLPDSILFNKKTSIIASDLAPLKFAGIDKNKVLYDKNNVVDKLKLPIHNLTFIETKNKSINKIICSKYCSYDVGGKIQNYLKL